jgi:hypothetical protein
MIRRVDFNKSQGYWNYLKAIRVNQLLLLFTVICLALLTATVQAAPVEEWSKTLGGTNDDGATYVQQTSDGGYILVGDTFSYGAGDFDVWLIKTDANGNQQWSKTFGGTDFESAWFVQQTSDGGYMIAGGTYSYGAGNDDVWLIKTDANGNQQWSNTFGSTNYDWAYFGQQTSDGGYILAGCTNSYGAGNDDAWLIKTDTNGNQQWSKTFGGTDYDCANSVQQTSDGGYMIAGGTNSYGAGNDDVWLIKTDTNGNQQWSKTFGGTDYDWASSVQQTSDGGYILAGCTNSYGAGNDDAWLIKTDTNGNQQWSKTFGSTDYDWANSVQQTSDGGYMIAGGTNSYGAGNDDVWLIKTDTNGNLQWSKTFGGAYDDWAWSVQQISDGGYILAGVTYSYGAGNADAWLIKVSSEEDILPDTIGVYQISTGNFFLKNSITPGPADENAQYGPGGTDFLPMVGDWDGDGTDTIGVYQISTGNFFLKNSIMPGPADENAQYGPGGADFLPMVGDWDGDGTDTIGVYQISTGNFFLKNSIMPGPADENAQYGPGGADFLPMVGDWDGDGTDTIGVYQISTGNFFLKNSITPGPADENAQYGPGGADFLPMVGDWDGL